MFIAIVLSTRLSLRSSANLVRACARIIADAEFEERCASNLPFIPRGSPLPSISTEPRRRFRDTRDHAKFNIVYVQFQASRSRLARGLVPARQERNRS